MYDLSVYDEAFFANVEAEGFRHAEWFIPLLVETFHPAAMIDVGCGTGPMVKIACHAGIDTWGIEGSEWGFQNRCFPRVNKADLRYAVEPRRIKYPLAISLEVAEHIEAEFAGTFVDTLCGLSDTVVMTAATPGQGGHWHVNEQPREYWIKRFSERGFVYDHETTMALTGGAIEARNKGHHVAGWMLTNMFVFRRAA